MNDILYRILYMIGVPFFFVYMTLPPLWLINIPYWVITNRNLMNDLADIYIGEYD